MLDMVKAFADVTLDNPVIACVLYESAYTFQRHSRVPHGAKSIGVDKELCFQYWLQHKFHALLYDSVPYCGDTQWALFGLSWLVDVHPAYWLWLKVTKGALNVSDNPREGFLQIIFSHPLFVYTRGLAAVVAFDIVDCCNDGCFC